MPRRDTAIIDKFFAQSESEWYRFYRFMRAELEGMTIPELQDVLARCGERIESKKGSWVLGEIAETIAFEARSLLNA